MLARPCAVAAAVCFLASGSALGQPLVGAGEEARQQDADAKMREAPAEPETAAAAPAPTPPQTVVVGKRHWGEAEKVGPYGQPKWTTQRRFPGTRVYVAPPLAATFEFWAEPKISSDGSDARVRTLYELSLGLGLRLQLDLYVRLQHDGTNALQLESERIELRWALADWGVIPGNPALYLEWIRQTVGPQRLEAKLLFGGAFTDRLYWGLNLFFERELWGSAQEHEYGGTAGLSYALLDGTFSLGGELRVEVVDRRDNRFVPNSVELLVGPALSFQPVEKAHVLLVAFVGPELEREDPSDPLVGKFVVQPTLVLGWRF